MSWFNYKCDTSLSWLAIPFVPFYLLKILKAGPLRVLSEMDLYLNLLELPLGDSVEFLAAPSRTTKELFDLASGLETMQTE